MKETFPYEDIIGISRHISKNHPEIPLSERAARFSPFAAVNGYIDMIDEAARITEKWIELDESAKETLNQKLNIIFNFINEHPVITITYFEPDEKKEGGKYVTITCKVKKIDQYHKMIITDNDEITDQKIFIDNIFNITGDFFKKFELG